MLKPRLERVRRAAAWVQGFEKWIEACKADTILLEKIAVRSLRLRAMAQSLANIVVHLVFSTKARRQLLRDNERGELHAYIAGTLKNLDSPLIEINSVRDHIHILFV